MNLQKLTTRVTFNERIPVYLPDDPFHIFERLVKIYLTTNTFNATRFEVTSRTRTVEHSLFAPSFWDFSSWRKDNPQTLPILKWIYQEIPREFWKFNQFITVNLTLLKNSAQASKTGEIFIDTPGMKHKIKGAFVTADLRYKLEKGILILPDYETIAREVATWGDRYKYKFGPVKQTVAKKLIV